MSARIRTAEHGDHGSRRRRTAVVVALLTAAEALALHSRAGRWAGPVVVRCQAGHLFTTIWIPGASLKSLRFGPWRLQRCPVGRHWALVTPVDVSALDPSERQSASERQDLRIP